jgi:hypothetical protein
MSGNPTPCALIEQLDSHGRVQWRERIALDNDKRRFTIGRALDADVTLDDPYAAARHAAIEVTADGKLLVTDLDSANGIVVAGKRHHGVQNVEVPDGLLQIGRTRLRVRTTFDTLAAEIPDQIRPASVLRDPAWIAGISAIAGTAQLIYSSWLGAPRDLTSVVVTSMISAIAAAGVWVAFWSLLSRVILGEWRWLRHAAIFLGVAVVFFAINGLTDLSWFAFSLPHWANRAAWTGAIAFACALYLHLTNASNISANRAALIACIVPAISGGAGQWVQDRAQIRDVNYIGAGLRIYPPALHLSAANTQDAFFDKAMTLREAADKKRKATHLDEDDAESSDDDT